MDAMLAATADAEDAHFWFKALRRTAEQILSRALNGRRDWRILDCGAGTGRNLDWLSAHGSAAGVELSPTGLAVARAHHRRVAQATVTHLPIADASIDVVTSFDVLYCLPDADERAALAEMRRVLRPGGWLLVNVAALDLLRGSHSTLTMEVRRYTPERLRSRLQDAGFVVERLTYTNCLTFPMTLAVRSADRLFGRADTASAQDLQVPLAPINAALDLLLRLEHLALRVTNLPIGSSLLCLARTSASSDQRAAGDTVN
jgi:SAM-dependent methyltransferase